MEKKTYLISVCDEFFYENKFIFIKKRRNINKYVEDVLGANIGACNKRYSICFEKPLQG
jgi:hypothetical protein